MWLNNLQVSWDSNTIWLYKIIAWYPSKNVEERVGEKGLEADEEFRSRYYYWRLIIIDFVFKKGTRIGLLTVGQMKEENPL